MQRVEWGRVAAYVVIAYGLAWLVAMPLWLKGGLQSPLFLPLSLLMMFTPTMAAVAVTRFGPRSEHAGGLAVKPEKGRIGALVLYGVIGIGLALVINLGALGIGQAVGVFHFDLEHFSAFQALIEAKLAGRDLPANMPPMWVLVASQLLVVVIASPINALAAVGEEIGWRGFLLPRLMPLGTVPAIIVSGVVWALWHAPLVLLGYNYPDSPPWLALGCMSGMCVALGAVLAWLRLRTRSVWPCALFHGAINAGAGFYLLLGTMGDKVDLTQATLLGWTGWIIPLVMAALLFALWPIGSATQGAAPNETPAPV